MIPTQIYIEAFKQLVPFQIKFKSSSWSQRILAFLVRWYIPTYLTHYTTVIGKSIYFPDERLMDHPNTKFSIAHEVVHLMDQRRLTIPLFLFLYLSPQIFALGVFSFPWLGYDALWFLIFVLPWPSPGRVYLEARAYSLERFLYFQSGNRIDPFRFVNVFQSSGYYFMSWRRLFAKTLLDHFYLKAQKGTDPIFNQIISTFNSFDRDDSSKRNSR